MCVYVIVCRSSVVGNFKNEDIFLEHEGMFLLLDLLEVWACIHTFSHIHFWWPMQPVHVHRSVQVTCSHQFWVSLWICVRISRWVQTHLRTYVCTYVGVYLYTLSPYTYGTIHKKLNVLRLYYVRTYGYRSVFIPRVSRTTSLVEAYLQNG